MTLVSGFLTVSGVTFRMLGKVLVLSIAFAMLGWIGMMSAFLLDQGLLTPADEGVRHITTTLHSPASAADATEQLELLQQYWKYRRENDVTQAIAVLHRCAEPSGGWEHHTCELLYAEALLSGDGVDRDESQAFRLLAELEKANPGSEVPQLVGLYDRAAEMGGNRVLVSVYVWRADHDPYFGFTKSDQVDTFPDEVAALLDSQMSSSERALAREIERVKYPRTIRLYGYEHAINSAVFVITSAVFVSLCWLMLRSGRKRSV